MPINKVVGSFDDAVADMADGATILIGGFGTVFSMPSCLLEAVDRKGVKDLTMVSNVAGLGPDIWKLNNAPFIEDMDILVRNERIKKAIVSAPWNPVFPNNFEKLYRAGKIEMEMVPQGTLAERIRAAKAGVGGVYIPTGVGTAIEEGKEKRVIDGREYILEFPIKADFALIYAHKGDRWGNLVYEGTSRTFNPTMAGAANVTIAEVDEIVELGDLVPDVIVTPGIYVDRVVERPEPPATDQDEVSDELAKEAYAKGQAEIRRATDKGGTK
jgi:3-oxoadipate CoA-transferase alpha subunit